MAEERHFGQAAARLFIAQPGLSQQIRRLEEEVGTPLFNRTTRSVELTDAGKVLLPEARRVLVDVERAKTAVTRSVDGEVGTLRVGFVSSAALAVVPSLTSALRQRWSGLTLELTEMTTDPQLDALRSGDLDIGLVREVEDAVNGITLQPVRRDRLYVAVHHSHRLAAYRSVALAELAGEGFVVLPRPRASRLHDHIARMCIEAGIHMTVVQEALQFSTILGLVAGNTGVAIVPEPLLALRLAGLRFVALEDAAATSLISIAFRTDRAETMLIRNALDAALEIGQGNPGVESVETTA